MKAEVLPVEKNNPDKNKAMEELKQKLSNAGCASCGTAAARWFSEKATHMHAVMLIGEGPGEEEDRLGRPFVEGRDNCWIEYLQPADSKDSGIHILRIL